MPIPARKEQTRASVPSQRESKDKFARSYTQDANVNDCDCDCDELKAAREFCSCSISNALLQLFAILHYSMSTDSC